MAQREYKKRIADRLLQDALKANGAVWILGPKWSGKTWTALQAARSSLMMQDPDQSINYLQQAAVKPSLLLAGETPRLLDEWQMAPVLWDAVRYAVDQRGKMGQFILTGSTMPLRHEVMHSGTGRIARLKMRTMSLFESGESSGQVSLRDLFNGKEPEGKAILSIEELAFAVARGGWPASISISDQAALSQAGEYLKALIQTDIYEVDDVKRDPQKISILIRSL